jgi:hypothetical protein
MFRAGFYDNQFVRRNSRSNYWLLQIVLPSSELIPNFLDLFIFCWQTERQFIFSPRAFQCAQPRAGASSGLTGARRTRDCAPGLAVGLVGAVFEPSGVDVSGEAHGWLEFAEDRALHTGRHHT